MDVSKYQTVGEWYAEHRGRVPIQMAAALDTLMKDESLTFPDAYARLVAAGRITEIDEPNDGER